MEETVRNLNYMDKHKKITFVMKKIIIPILMFISLSHLCFGQHIKSMGFSQPVVIQPSNFYMGAYLPKLKIIDDILYVCSHTGIHKKNLKDDTNWELYAFKNIPIIEFVKNGEQVLAISTGKADGTDSLLLLSNDNGKTFINFTSPHFLKWKSNYLVRIAQNPKNSNSILILGATSGVSKSDDFGITWKKLNEQPCGYQDWELAFHPFDTTTLFYSGETDLYQGTIRKSSDNGETWSEYGIHNNCIHSIAFHPTIPDILVYGGEYHFGKSTDRGETWKRVISDSNSLYFYKVLFDEENPAILYASGAYNGPGNDTIKIHRSTDMGESWHLFHKEFVTENCVGEDCGFVIDMLKYKNKLIFYTFGGGLFELDLGTNTGTPTGAPDFIIYQQSLIVFPNPTHDILQFKTKTAFNQVEIIDLTGRILLKTKISNNEGLIDISKLNSGIYFAVFYADALKITKKIIVEK